MFYQEDEDLEGDVSNNVHDKLFIFLIFRNGLSFSKFSEKDIFNNFRGEEKSRYQIFGNCIFL